MSLSTLARPGFPAGWCCFHGRFSVSRGRLSFDLDTYRSLDAASRRLFLLLQKVFWRRKVSFVFDVRHLVVDAQLDGGFVE